MNMASSFATSPYNPPHAWPVRGKGTSRVSASKYGGLTFIQASKGCKTCSGKGAIECPGCKGSGRNKKNGNIFERWKCFDCQGFGMKSCPNCGKGGLTPEQRGER
ncbi:protein EMBRYO SAC DEVELOPMENT ARREST 3, chloroplastic isoform X1 [Iris pallida]|uniref:Protein EMBRYO SAC DEVELOPMENT ARREST 3, chloroplastic isoform X1 n=1 Tax=Iris pallida TaxID=29817 RepID=A0AAX6FM17_IRIPA|nr:protein EMBRYO SAC DEVELOPMENT ARREST 3, chloroplastic isoform X1 [Iris pallida]